MSEIKLLDDAFKNGSITRRSFIGKITAFGALSVCDSIIRPSILMAATPQKGRR